MSALDGPSIDLDALLDLVGERVAATLDLEETAVPEARFAEDLHADSLDLLEVVEGVEAELRARGLTMSLSEQDFLAIRTVRDAAERILAAARRGRP